MRGREIESPRLTDFIYRMIAANFALVYGCKFARKQKFSFCGNMKTAITAYKHGNLSKFTFSNVHRLFMATGDRANRAALVGLWLLRDERYR